MTESSIIDVLVVIDADAVVARYGENVFPEDPTEINSDLITVIAPHGCAIGDLDDATRIKASVSDVIRWRETSLSLNTDHAVFFYEVAADPVTPPLTLVVTMDTPLADPDAPIEPKRQEIRSHLRDCLVTKTGEIYYRFRFMVLDSKGHTLGYYSWAPTLVVETGEGS